MNIQSVFEKTYGLTPRQAEVATLVAHGLTSIVIADSLCVSEKVIKFHLGRVYAKMHFKGKARVKDHKRQQLKKLYLEMKSQHRV